MSTERETKSFTTTGGHTVVAYAYLTYREFNELEAVFLSAAKIDVVGKSTQLSGFDATVQQKYNDLLLEKMLVSVDGIDVNLAAMIGELPAADGLEILETVSEFSGKKKTTSSPSAS